MKMKVQTLKMKLVDRFRIQSVNALKTEMKMKMEMEEKSQHVERKMKMEMGNSMKTKT